jgi:pimeloyl-ACP methyl ester carboxylesterase
VNEAKYRAAEQKLWRTVGVAVSERRVRMRSTGTDVRVQIAGEGSGKPVLFIHGGPNTGSTWAPLLEHLEGFRCFVVDRPGTGLSDDFVMRMPGALSIADRFVADLLDGLELERAHVVASSFGGFLALRSAAATPTRFDRMVQMACPAFAPGMLTPKFMQLMRFGFVRWLLPKLPPSKRSNDDIMRQIGHGASLDANRIPAAFTEWYADMLRYTNTMKNDLAMIGGALVGDRFDPTLTLDDSILRSVRAPTSFLWGTDDGFGGEDVARRVVAAMPDASLEMFAESGHLPWLDDPRTIAARVSSFLST